MTTQTSRETTLQKNETHAPEAFETAARTVVPRVDIFENNDETWLVFDVPGAAQNDLHVEVEKDELRLFAKAAPVDDEAEPFAWERAFRLPPGFDAARVAAELKDGVLTLKLPKPTELKPRKIEVKVA